MCRCRSDRIIIVNVVVVLVAIVLWISFMALSVMMLFQVFARLVLPACHGVVVARGDVVVVLLVVGDAVGIGAVCVSLLCLFFCSWLSCCCCNCVCCFHGIGLDIAMLVCVCVCFFFCLSTRVGMGYYIAGVVSAAVARYLPPEKVAGFSHENPHVAGTLLILMKPTKYTKSWT